LETRLKKAEDAMAQSQARLAEINALMAQADFYTDAWRDRRPGLLAEHGELTKALQASEDEWLQVQAEIETLEV
jgi:ATP-binding cassette subfamily F protein 3